MFAPFYERNALQIGSELAPTGSAVTTDILNVGLQPPPNSSGPYAGALVNFSFTQSGGSTDSDLTISAHLSFDGTVVDDEAALAWTTAGATSAAAYSLSRVLLACEANITANDTFAVPIGVAVQFSIVRADGDKTIDLDVYARRFWWVNWG